MGRCVFAILLVAVACNELPRQDRRLPRRSFEKVERQPEAPRDAAAHLSVVTSESIIAVSSDRRSLAARRPSGEFLWEVNIAESCFGGIDGMKIAGIHLSWPKVVFVGMAHNPSHGYGFAIVATDSGEAVPMGFD